MDSFDNTDGSTLIRLTIVICSCIVFLLLALFFFCSDGLTVDNASLLVSSLALITTVLIGFQIWNIVDFDKRLSRAVGVVKNELHIRIDDEVKAINKKFDTKTFDNLGLSLSNLAAFFATDNKYIFAIKAYIQSLSILYFGDSSSDFYITASNDSIHGLATILRERHNDIEKMNPMKFHHSVIIQCMEVVYRHKNKDDVGIIISFMRGPKIIVDDDEPFEI